MSTPPKHLRLQVQGGNKQGGKILLKLYTPIPQLHKIEKINLGSEFSTKEAIHPNGFDENMQPLSGTWESFKPKLTDAGGTNYQHRDEQTVFVILDDDNSVYDITVTDQVLMSFGFPPVAVADFFEEEIVANLANFFGIDQANIRVVNVIREDTVLRRKRDTNSTAPVVGLDLEVTTPDEVNSNSTSNKDSVRVVC